MSKKTRLVVMQPTSFCNLNCSYCYVPNRQNTSRMSLDILELAIKCVFADKEYKKIDFLYHAREPMTVGMDFYKEAIRLIDKYAPTNVNITNTIQTNINRFNITQN